MALLNVQDMIDNAASVWSEEKSADRHNEYFHISDAGLCYRSRFLKRQGVPSTRVTPVGALRKMLAGEAGHEKLQAILRATGVLESSEDTLMMGSHIMGHYDGVVRNDNADSLTLLEFKTVEKFQMGHIKKSGPKPQHIIQMFTYWQILRQTKKVEQATLVYVQREDFQQVQYDYLWDMDIVERTQAEWAPLLAYWEKQELPPCTCSSDYGGAGVNYCRYQAADKEHCCNETLFRKAYKAQTNEVSRVSS